MSQLTKAEKQDIVRYLDADKPLPDKYRFLIFDDKREVELLWNGKTNEVCNSVLPFQTIEQVDEPRSEGASDKEDSLAGGLFDPRGRQMTGWTNKLIWGDNKLILSSLKNGPMRDEIERQGGIKLIYIDPPFDVGADFSMDIEVGDGSDTLTKQPNILEEIAYRDTWGKGDDSFIAMLYERLILMRDLLASDGSIYVQCDWRLNSVIRLLMDEIFGREMYRNEIIWKRDAAGLGAKKTAKQWGRNVDSILFYSRSNDKWQFIPQFKELTEKQKKVYSLKEDSGRRYKTVTLGDYSEKSIARMEKEGLIHISSTGTKYKKYYLDEGKAIIDLIWSDILSFGSRYGSSEYLAFPTQKPELLLDRILKSATTEGDLVADFFCGSGTTAAVAEKLGRKWIASDLGKFAIHTSRKRMLSVQRQLKADGQDYRAFEILNLGKYERQHFVGTNPNLRDKDKQAQLDAKESAFLDLILNAYRAERVEGFKSFYGKKAGRLVAVGPINLPVTRLFIEELILECRKKHITKVDILGFEFEMGLFPNVLEEARSKGIDIAPRYIPTDVFDKRAIEKNQVVFHDVAYIEVKPHISGGEVAIELTDFSVFYSQDSIKAAEDALTGKKTGNRVVVEQGQIVKVTKNKAGILSREVLTKYWTDWIDYWAVDFDFESKREIIRVQAPETDEWTEEWTGEYVFENEWQSFRTRKDRSLEFTSVRHECPPGPRKVAIKVVDIFGNDTMTIVEVNIPKRGGKK